MKRRIISTILSAALFVALLVPVPASAAYFRDTDGHWAADIIDIWSDYGIVQGSNDQFYPNEYIRRVDLALMISRVMGYKDITAETFRDLDGLTEEQITAILLLNKAGVMLGSGRYMRPNDYISREEAAVMFGRMLRMNTAPAEGTYFSDMHNVSDWANVAVSIMGKMGYMSGRTSSKFDPKANITRAEVIQILDNIINGYYGKAGTYSVSTLGNVVINSPSVELRQVAITGDLFITENVANGTITLRDVTVKGNVYVLGGSGIKLIGNTHLGEVYHEKIGADTTKYQVQPPAAINDLYVSKNASPLEYEGPLGSMYIHNSNQTIIFNNATVLNLIADAPGISLTANENTSINTARVNFQFHMLGKGIISLVHIASEANGSSFERQPKSAVLPAGITIFMAGETYTNRFSRNQTVNAVEDNIYPIVNNAALTATKLTSDGATFTWNSASDNITAQNSMRYALYYSTSPYMYTVPYIEANGTMFTSFVPGRLNTVVAGLKTGQVYYFNVIVKDQADNKSCYAPFTLKVGKDIDAPVPGSSNITITDLKTKEATLSWSRAKDNVTDQTKLIYTLYQSQYNNIGSVTDCERNGRAVMKASADKTSHRITGLKQNLSYYFNVVVSDEAGNKASYSMISIGKDSSPPQLANSAIKASGLKSTEVTLNWIKAVDDLSEASKLKYTVYRSETNNIRNVAECEKNGKVIMKASTDKDTYRATGLKEYSLYYFNIVVTDEADNKTSYTPVSVTPVTDFVAPVPPGNSKISVVSTTEDSARLIWAASSDDVSPAPLLKYSVYYSDSPNIRTVSEIRKDGIPIMSPTQGRLYCDFKQPPESSGTNYINILVEDEAGNVACYSMLKLRLGQDIDAPVPPADSGLRLTDWTKTSASLAWLAADDMVGGRVGSATSELLYAVYYMPATGSDPSINFGTVSQIESKAVWNSGFTRDIQSLTVKGLTENKKYYFNVIVKDKAGLKGCYTPRLVITDDVPPDVTASAIDVTSDSQQNLKIAWGIAVDPTTDQDELLYALYYSINNEHKSISDIERYAKPMTTDYIPYSEQATTLSGVYYETPYYFYVIVMDQAGNKAKYQTRLYVLNDTTPPLIEDSTVTPGTEIYDAATNTYMIRLSWVLAKDNVSTDSLNYSIYVASEKYESKEALLASGTPLLSHGRKIAYFDHSGLAAGTYYYHVLVEDDAGNKSLYSPCRVVIPTK